MPAPASKQADVAARRAEVLRLRAAGMTYPQIAEQLGYSSPGAASVDASRALRQRRDMLGRQADLLPVLEAERLDAMERRVQSIMAAAASAGDHETVLAAVDRLVRIGDARSRLRGTVAAGPVADALHRDLDKLSPGVRTGAVAQAAIMLAGTLDAGMSPRDAAATSRELRLTMLALAEISPERAEEDPVDEIGARRDARLAADR